MADDLTTAREAAAKALCLSLDGICECIEDNTPPCPYVVRQLDAVMAELERRGWKLTRAEERMVR